MSSYVEDLAAWKQRGTGVVDDWADEVRRAKDDGHISCAECGHEIDPEEHDEKGCHAFDSMLPNDNFPTGCPCPLRLTLGDISKIYQTYEWGPFVMGSPVYWAGDPLDEGRVIGFSTDNLLIQVKWSNSTKPSWEDHEDLATQPG